MRAESRYQSIDDARSRERADALMAWLRDYTSRRLDSRVMDQRRTIQPHVLLDLGNHGAMGMQVEERHGGLGLLNRDVARVLEQAAAIDLSLGTFLLICMFPGIRPIAAFGSDRLKDEVLPELARGRMLAGYGQTEVDAGSYFQNMSAVARRAADGSFSVTGDKVWIGNANWAGILTVMAQDVDAEGKRRGLIALAVRSDQAGVTPGRELLSMGMRGVVQSEIRFRDAVAGPDDVLGESAAALDVGVDSMSFSRFAIAATCIGAMKRAAQLMTRFAGRRKLATGRLLDHAATRVALADSVMRITAADVLLQRIAEELDAGRPVPIDLFAAAKVAGSEFLCQVTDRLMQLLGSRGYDEANLVPQLVRDARVTRIFEGATEALLAFLGGQAANPRSDLHHSLREVLEAPALADEVAGTAAALRERRSEDGGEPLPRNWQLIRAGEVALWALLVAAVAQRERRSPGAETALALDWCAERFGAAVDAAREGSPEDLLLGADDLVEKAIHGYGDALGDLDPGAYGEKLDFDALLRRDAPGS